MIAKQRVVIGVIILNCKYKKRTDVHLCGSTGAGSTFHFLLLGSVQVQPDTSMFGTFQKRDNFSWDQAFSMIKHRIRMLKYQKWCLIKITNPTGVETI
jgi:hypothetical protein